MCRALVSPPAPSTWPTRGRIGGIWSMPGDQPVRDRRDRRRAAPRSRSWRRSARTRAPPPAPRPPTAGSAGPDSSGPIAARTTLHLRDQQAQRCGDHQRDDEAEERPAAPRSRGSTRPGRRRRSRRTRATRRAAPAACTRGDRRRPDAPARPPRNSDQRDQRRQRRWPATRRHQRPAWSSSGCRARPAPRRPPRRPRGRRRLGLGSASSARDAAASGHAAWLVMTSRSRR